MFKRIARVIARRDDRVLVALRRESMCGCCSNMFCGVKKESHMSLKDPFDLKAGDRVELGLESYMIVGLSLLIFFMPSLVFIGGVYGLKGMGEPLSFLLSILGVVLYFIVLKAAFIDRSKERLSCKIIRKL